MRKQVLIVDKRIELSTKYKKIIESLGNNVLISDRLDDVFKKVQSIEPDLILISDSIVDNISDFCKKLRILTYNTRPVIVAISKSSETEDKVKVLENGADDFLSEPISSQEFKVRILAHLRREEDNFINDITGIPNKNYTFKQIKRTLSKEEKKCFMLLSIENFEEYKSIYTDLASNKLLQTYCAIIKSSLNDNDFIGQLSENKFIAIINNLYVEKIASFLTFAFDSIVQKFYSEQDVKRGYMLLHGDEKEGRRAEFVYTKIGIITNEHKNYNNTQEIINDLREVHELSKKVPKSSFLIQRPQISSKNSILEKEYNNNILVIENDEALSLLLKTSIELQGYKVSINTISEKEPSVILIDAGDVNDLSGLQSCIELKNNFVNSKIIVTSVLHDKEKILNSGADLYLPKPYNILSVLKWINLFCEDYNK